MEFRGGPAALTAAGAEVVLALGPGEYGWVCFAPDHEGNPHVLGGTEAKPFTVRARAGEAAPPMPEASATIRMLDWAYELPDGLAPGEQVIRVVNDGTDPHHVLVFRVLPGRSVDEVTTRLETGMQGEAPAELAGAMAEMSTGQEALLELDLPAGEYVLICLVAGRDGVPHVAKGMIRHVRVG